MKVSASVIVTESPSDRSLPVASSKCTSTDPSNSTVPGKLLMTQHLGLGGFLVPACCPLLHCTFCRNGGAALSRQDCSRPRHFEAIFSDCGDPTFPETAVVQVASAGAEPELGEERSSFLGRL